MYKIVNSIMSSDEIKNKISLPSNCKKLKLSRDNIIKEIIAGKDSRKLVIIGPCSADNEDAVCDYVSRLANVSQKVKDKIFLVPRIYTNKPRTRGEGYKGMMHSPNPSLGTDIQGGIESLRRMHIRAMQESGLSAADEMLYPDNYDYVDDLLSYVTIGARSTENQQHRLVASGMNVPVGIKNPMNGSFAVTLNSIYASHIANEFKYQNNQVKTPGNQFAHAVLRGSVDVFGNNIPNYHYEDIIKFGELYAQAKLDYPAVIIDTNHSNSSKEPLEQIRIVNEVMSNCKYNRSINTLVKGFLIESYIVDGHQAIGGSTYGQSLTDACIGWDKTERLLYSLADLI